jgi:DNA-binding MarR family transcriptional regulator
MNGLRSLDAIRREHVGALLGLADCLVAERVTAAMNARGFEGIRRVHIALIRNLSEDGTRITEIARRAGMTKPATSQLVAEFVALGYIRIVPDATDRRVKVAQYTERGHQLLDAIVASLDDVEGAVAATIGAPDLQRLKAILGRVLAGAR